MSSELRFRRNALLLWSAQFISVAGDSLFIPCLAWLAAATDRLNGATPRIAPFCDIRQLGDLLQRAGFALPVLDIDRLRLRYGTPLALMREIKALGLANTLVARARNFVPPGLLRQAASAYPTDPDGRITVTLALCFLAAWAPHPDQPKPAAPGSAKTHLADALGWSGNRLKSD